MKLFWKEIIETPDKKAILTKGGLRINFSIKELQKFFGSLLDKHPLECMVAETSYWVLIPSLVSIYSFPIILLITLNPWYALMSSLGLLISMSLFNQSSYNYYINKYIVRPAASLAAKLAFYLIMLFLLNKSGVSGWLLALPLIWWIFNDFVPLIYLAIEMLLLKAKMWMWNLADPDGVLRQVGIYWAKKHGLKTNENGRVLE